MQDLDRIFTLAHGHEAAARLEAAEAAYRACLALAPASGRALNGLGVVARKAGRLSHARAVLERGLRVAPGSPAIAANLARAAEQAGDEAMAEALLNDVIRANPGYGPARAQLGQLLYRRGDVRRALAEEEWRSNNVRFRTDARYRGAPPVWDGEALPGRTLAVYIEGGYGDAMMFARYLPMAAERCARVAVFGMPALAPFLRTLHDPANSDPASSDPAGRVLFNPDAGALPPVGARLLQLSLPHALRDGGTDIPGRVPYLSAEPARAAAWAARLAALPGPRVGLFWRTGDPLRSLPPADLAALMRGVPGTPVALQPDPTDEERRMMAGAGVRWFDALAADAGAFLDTAALVSALDLTITIDSAVAHVAGALGRPVWLLLPHFADARWRRADTTEWYPTMRLFRQPVPARWTPLVAAVTGALANWRAAWGPPPPVPPPTPAG